MMVLRQKLLGRAWTKPAYLLSMILQELQKLRDQQLHWLLCFDTDTVLVNPTMPLELFLPPLPQSDHIHFLCASDHNGLNAGTFLLRISEYSLHLMAAALLVESFRPDVDLLFSDQSAFEYLLSDNDTARYQNSTYADGYARIPQRWINAFMGP
jgi:galactosyl transferase GMA12/MNN10 family